MYKILQDPDNDLLLVIEPQDCEPDGPMFIYDGDWFSNVRLNDIGSDAREQLLSAQVIYVLEKSGDDIAREYAAPIRIVRDVKSLMM